MENYFNALKSKIYKNFAPTTSSRDIDALYNRSSSKKLTEKFKKRHTTISVKTFKDWEWAMKLLEKIKAGKETPEGLPEKISDGAPAGSVISGNGKTSEYYY